MQSIEPEHQLLLLIASESKSSKKKAALMAYKGSSKLKNIFKYALDPFKKYYIKLMPGFSDAGVEIIGPDTWRMLDDLASRRYTGADAKNRLFNHMGALKKSERILLKKIVKHKLSIGVAVKTVNQVWPGLISDKQVQKAEDWDPTKAIYPCYGSIKLDGIRADYHKGTFTTRSGHTVSNLGHIAEYLNSLGEFTKWDGELIVPDRDFDTGSGIIRSEGNKMAVHYAVFDMPGLPFISLRSRYGLLSSKLEKYHPIATITPASYLYHKELHNEEQVFIFYNQCLAYGFEGVMIKNPNAYYTAGRDFNWMKLKKNFEAEYEIVDFYEGKGKYAGVLGGVIIDIDGKHVRVGGGFTDIGRIAMWRDHSFLGRFATVTAMEKTKSGSLRHPIYKSIRWDI